MPGYLVGGRVEIRGNMDMNELRDAENEILLLYSNNEIGAAETRRAIDTIRTMRQLREMNPPSPGRRYQDMVSEYYRAMTTEDFRPVTSTQEFYETGTAFQNSKTVRTCARMLEIWEDEKGKQTLIDKMSKKKLKLAIQQLEDGWRCWGQGSKIVSLKRVLKERYNA